MKVDLHTHTFESEEVHNHFLGKLFGVRDSYTKPKDAYYQAMYVKGLDGFAITNHNVIGHALKLSKKYPEQVIVGCEYTVEAGYGYKLHVIALDLNESLHKELNQLRYKGLKTFTHFLKKEDIPYFLAHIGVSVVPKLKLKPELIDEWVSHFYAIETINGLRTVENEFAKKIAKYYGLAETGGSDAHEVSSIGHAYTVSDKAKNLKEFLEDIKKKQIYAGGDGANPERFEKEIKSIIRDFYYFEFKPIFEKGLQTYMEQVDIKGLFKRFGELFLLLSYIWLPKIKGQEYIKGQYENISLLEEELISYLKERRLEDLLQLSAKKEKKIALWREETGKIYHTFDKLQDTRYKT